MIIVSGKLCVLPERRKEVLAAAHEMSERALSESGCISYEFAEPLDDAASLRLFEEWTDGDALLRHRKSESFAAFSESIRATLTARPQIMRYEVCNARPLLARPNFPAADGYLGEDATARSVRC